MNSCHTHIFFKLSLKVILTCGFVYETHKVNYEKQKHVKNINISATYTYLGKEGCVWVWDENSGRIFTPFNLFSIVAVSYQEQCYYYC